MRTFTKWAEETNKDLDTILDVERPSKTTKENSKRTGYSANYPPAYASGQYPHKYFNPTKATADLDKEIMDKKRK
jgi:hypothetical protein